ncbi:m7GpppN-mRNA hydrolase [Malaya genurostris]|uniref:m7GpppN-mRNA hydrolase n=1 Tax=Malaya genurostris TaxID=325434 RepID=UPI0026F37E76|nr:m7GpppN-mRNA hydrolase [Malaya genurostris]
MTTNSPVSMVLSASVLGKTKTTQPQQPQPLKISSDILDDLGSRFIINVPVEERENLIRICFQIELAHWFYLDFYCSVQKQKCGIKQFAFQLFEHIPFLRPHLISVDTILDDWKQYKLTVPTYGAILLSEDLKHVLLVQSFWAKSSWGFPKGKINENEEPLNCAIREVYEETGYDIKNLIVPSEYIELVINYQYTRLYLVSGVPFSTVFSPRTRNEIKCCEWFPIELLPVTKNDNFVKNNLSLNGNSFFMILPFIKRLKKWLEKLQKSKHKGGTNKSPVFSSAGKQNSKYSGNSVSQTQPNNNRQRQRHKSLGDIEQQQRSKSSGSQQVTNTQLNQSNSIQNTPNASTSTADGYKYFLSESVETQLSTSTSNKKSVKKQVHHEVGVNNSITGTGGGGRSQTKRKLFEAVPNADVQIEIANKDPYAMFDVSTAWMGFKLDYSKFV